MVLLDTRQQATDEAGNILTGGQYRFFKYKTNTPVNWYADPDYVTDMGVTMQLDGAGWPPMTAYFKEDITVHSFKYLGMDEYGTEMYAPVKNWELTSTNAASGSASATFISTITNLRELEATHGTSVIVTGYHSQGDMPPIVYTYDMESTGLDNGGNVIASAVMSTGRWLCTYGEQVDCRNFGVVSGISSINSYLANAVQYCNMNSRRLVFVRGTYNLYGSGTLAISCPLKVDKYTQINVTSGSYTFTSSNKDISITNTFCGTGLKLILNGEGYENTNVPISAWDLNAGGFDEGTAVFNLVLNNKSSERTWAYGKTYNNIILADGTHYIDANGQNIIANELLGTGTIHYITETCIIFETVNLSKTNFPNVQAVYTNKLVVLDTPVTLHKYADISAHIMACGAGSLDTFDGSCTLRGGISGKSRFIISDKGLCLGSSPIQSEFFSNADCLVKTWNKSPDAAGELDMGRMVSGETITRTGKICNGSIGGVTCPEITLERMVVNGNITSGHVTAKDTHITGYLLYLQSSRFDNVTLDTDSQINCSNSVWNEVSIPNGTVRSYGGGFRFRDVFANRALFYANTSRTFSNASWIGGSCNRIDFDASMMGLSGEATAFNVEIQNLLCLSENINSINGDTMKWAINGHYNIKICNNEGQHTRRSMGDVFALLKYKYKRVNTDNSTVGYVIGLDTEDMFIFRKWTNSTVDGTNYLNVAYSTAVKPFAFPSTGKTIDMYPANTVKPYPASNCQPCAHMGSWLYMRYNIEAGAKNYTGGGDYIDGPGEVNAQNYYVNFRIYP